METNDDLIAEIDSKISALEAEASFARAAIRRHNRRMRRNLLLAEKALNAANRTRVQHLDRPNREIADLIELKQKITE